MDVAVVAGSGAFEQEAAAAMRDRARITRAEFQYRFDIVRRPP
jgi:hypothetical protein